MPKLTSTPSLGFGIGLQAAPKDYANIYLAKDQARQRREAAKAKAKRDDDKVFRDIFKEIKITGVHRLDVPRAKENMADLVYTLTKERELNPNNWQITVQSKILEARRKQAQYQENKKKLDSIGISIEANKALGLNTEAELAYDKVMKQGTYEELERLGQDPTGTIGFDPESKGIFHNPMPLIDTSAEIDKYLKDPTFKSGLESIRDKEYTDPKGGVRTFDVNYIPRTEEEAAEVQARFNLPNRLPSLESLAGTLSANPKFVRRMTYEMQKSGLLPKDLYFLAAEEQKQLYKDALIDNMAQKAGVKITSRIATPFAPKRAREKDVPDYSGGLEVQKKYNVADEKGKIVDTITSSGIISFDPQKASIAISADVIDGRTMKPVKETGTSKDVTTGQILFFAKFISKKGEKRRGIIPDIDLEVLRKTGSVDRVEYVAYVEVTSVEKVIVNNRETTDTRSYFVPLDELADNLKSKKAVDTDVAFEHAAKLTSDFRSKWGKLKTKEAPKETIKAGDVVAGWLFKGGDPDDSKNWSKK